MHLQGLKIVLTGKFEGLSRSEAQKKLEALGADVTGGVSSKTQLLVAGKKAGSKLAKAEKLGVPVFDQAQMQQLLDGATLEQLLEDQPQEEVATVQAVDFPEVVSIPRDGVWKETYEDGSTRVEGEYKAGLKHGSWKEYWPNGQIKMDYEWQHGVKHGHELDWAENGVQLCDGRNEHGKRQGKWTWLYESNGAFHMSYEYDSEGKKHGPHFWDLEDGTKRGRGQFEHGERSGDWTWWQEGKYSMLKRGHGRGRKTEEEAWYTDDQLAYRIFRDEAGEKHGLEESFYEDGKPKFRGEWAHGIPIGQHSSWDEKGALSEQVFELGLPEKVRSNKKLAEKVAKKLEKARDNYKKYDILDDAVEYGQAGPYLVFLWREKYYDTAADPETWDKLKEAKSVFSGELLLEFLASIKSKKMETGYTAPHLQYWPRELDDIVMDVYLRDPGPIDAGWRDLPPHMMKGVASCIARFGTDIGDVLHSEMKALVHTHVNEYCLDEHINWPAEGNTHIEELQLLDRLSGRHSQVFEKYIEFFGGLDLWIKELGKRAAKECKESVARFSFMTYRVLVDQAGPEEMNEYIQGISLDSYTQNHIYESLVGRGYSAEDLKTISLGIQDNGLRKWPALCTAVLKFSEEGQAIPKELVDAFELATETPTYSSEWYTKPLVQLNDRDKNNPYYFDEFVPTEPGACVPRMELMRKALAAMTPEQRRSIFERHLNSDYSKLNVCPYLYLDRPMDLVEQVLELIHQDSYGYREVNMYGLGELGADILPVLLKTAKKFKKKAGKEGLHQALTVALARVIVEQGDFDPALDKHVRFDGMAKEYYYRFLEPYLIRIVHRLPQERAEAILLDGLSSKMFHRAFRCIASHPTPKVLQTAFAELLKRESGFNHEMNQAVQAGLSGLPDLRSWIKWLLQSGGGAGCKDALKSALGWKEFEELEKELAAGGVEAPKQMDQVDKIVNLAKKAGGSGERIYLLRRKEEDPGEAIGRIYGQPQGVGEDRWPMFNDEPMYHLFTLDLKDMPELAGQVGGDARSLSFFISDPGNNEAYEWGNEETALVPCTQAEIDAQPAPHPEAESDREAHSFEVVAVDLNPDIWESKDSDLRQEIYRASARFLGQPIWLQSDEGGGGYLGQFDEGFVDVNLGDCGIMYVFGDSSFWQCH